MTMWSSGYTVRHISPIEEQAALAQGADLFSESFIFFVSGGIVVYEYIKSSEKEKKKEEANLQKIRNEASQLEARLDSLDKRLLSLEEYAKANRHAIVLGRNATYVSPDEDVNSPEGSRRARRWWHF